MKLGFLYSGQGSQKVEMGKDFYENEKLAKDFYDGVNLEKDIKKLSFYSDEIEISKTENTQIILIAFQIMISNLLEKNNINPEAVSGLSIGEFAALYKSGVLSSEDTLKIAEFRGKKMSEVSDYIETSMYAIMGSEEKEINRILEKYSNKENFASISNINTKGQIVISGERKVVESSVEELKTLGSRAIKLKVSGPFHTKYMENVSKDLKEYFKNIDFLEEKIPVYYNFLGNKKTKENIKDLMTEQVKSTVRFEEDLRNMIDDGIDTFIEIGYSNILKGFVRKIDKSIKVYSISDYKSYLDFLKEFLHD